MAILMDPGCLEVCEKVQKYILKEQGVYLDMVECYKFWSYYSAESADATFLIFPEGPLYNMNRVEEEIDILFDKWLEENNISIEDIN